MLKRLLPFILTTVTLTIALPSQARNILKLPPKTGVAQPYCIDKGQISLNRCAIDWFKTSDFLRKRLAKDYTSNFSEAKTEEFKQIQKTWKKFRDAHCNFAAFQVQEGSAYPMTYNSCRAQVTNDRIADLQKWAPTNRPDLIVFQMLELHEQKLVRELKQETPQLAQYAKSNELWLKYRTEHCKLEQSQNAEPEETPKNIFAAKSKSCENRLAQLRSQQIEPLIDLGW